MTVNSTPPSQGQLTVIEIFHQTLAEAKLSKADSCSAALMFLGIVLCHVSEDEGHAHIMIGQAMIDLHNFVHDNYQALTMASKA